MSSGPDPLTAAGRSPALYRCLEVDQAEALNRRLGEQFEAARAAEDVRRSHYFEGRFENLYIPLARVPALATVLDVALATAAAWLDRPSASLRAGFWFNYMQPGQATLPHSHDEDDELLSAVYYVRVPPGCGDLLLHGVDGVLRITPQAGRLLVFAPHLVHEVEPNRSGRDRLSVGINIGPAPR